jgi:hypothetical protein
MVEEVLSHALSWYNVRPDLLKEKEDVVNDLIPRKSNGIHGDTGKDLETVHFFLSDIYI